MLLLEVLLHDSCYDLFSSVCDARCCHVFLPFFFVDGYIDAVFNILLSAQYLSVHHVLHPTVGRMHIEIPGVAPGTLEHATY